MKLILTIIITQDIELGHSLRRTDVGDRQASHQDTRNQRGKISNLSLQSEKHLETDPRKDGETSKKSTD